ncbi:dihydrofolate reductase region [Coriobacterium glomerans PW2]|uniref:dihydrofolate reductase n=1 Tax=Coriobacterium glomerans (strain ATCC 49209 / DSM 20642 / JCM 10262 / PW2) TaxID=700015 RepID=F2N7N9_CORGP|nr:dihydrofolate reductase [Coriobacterium glomerans]AEB06931.1 dihydrofolate reductase region [Coriobacterium glomerans PW2]
MRETESVTSIGTGRSLGSRASQPTSSTLPNLFAIVSVCRDWGIGCAGDMVVRNRVDMRHFVSLTRGHAVIMGRKTLESLPGGAPLRDRRNIVLTHDETFAREGVTTVCTAAAAIGAIAEEDEAWLIGGAAVYRLLLPFCSRAFVTKHDCVRTCDAYFPDLDVDPAWSLECAGTRAVLASGEGDEGLGYSFDVYVRSSL